MTGIEDTAVRGLSADGHIRVLACTTTHLVNELHRRHYTWPVASAALGRTASIAAMMALMLKGEERLTVQIRGDGPLGAIVVDADSEGFLRGYVEHPHVHLPTNALGKLDVGRAVGRGTLSVFRDMGLRDVYRGSTELQTGEIGDDFTYYFAVSEQTPSAVGAGVLVETDNSIIASGGFIVQLLPGHSEDHVAQVEERLGSLGSVTDILKQGIDARGLLQLVVPDATVLETRHLAFRCHCSRERVEAVLLSLGAAELRAMLEEQGRAEVTCHFCNDTYQFDRQELERMLHRALHNDGGGNR